MSMTSAHYVISIEYMCTWIISFGRVCK